MKIVAHCFAQDIVIDPERIDFDFKGFDVSIIYFDQKLSLQISKVLTASELDSFRAYVSDDSNDLIAEKFEQRLRPYKLVLTEAAQLFEGLLSLFYAGMPPHFHTDRPNINLYPETEDEQRALEEGTISRGGGYLSLPDKRKYRIDNIIFSFISPAMSHLPAFSFFSHALRSLKNNDNEVAFFLLFRILDGYFASGATNVEKEFLKQEEQLSHFILYDEKFTTSLEKILTEMKLPSHSASGFKGVIKDLVHIRHKLTHFSSSKAQNHHSANIIFELKTVNQYLYSGCFRLLRGKLTSA